MVFWNNLKEPINDNLKYFVSYWEYFCNFLEKPTPYTTIMTPHYLVKEIKNELATNGKENSNNMKYFFELIGLYRKQSYLFDNDINSLWVLLHEKFQEQEKNINVISSICNLIHKKMDSESYAKFIFDFLMKNLDAKSLKKTILNDIIETIIFELIFKGYSLSFTAKLINNIFAYYTIENIDGEEHLFTNYPHKTKYNFKSQKEYTEAVKNEIDSLTINKRLNRIFEFLTSTLNKYYFIFPIEGLSLQSSIFIDDIEFYNPTIKSNINDCKWLPEKDIFDDINYEHSANVMVSLKCRNIEFGENAAKEKVSKVFDFFRLYIITKADFKISNSELLVLDENKEFQFHRSRGLSKQFCNFNVEQNSEDFSDIIKSYNDCFSDTSISADDKQVIYDSLHFYRNGVESNSQEKKLLNYWIALERLFLSAPDLSNGKTRLSKIDRICVFTQHILINRYIYKNGWDCYHLIDRLLQTLTGGNGYMVPNIDIPIDLQIKAQIGLNKKASTVIKLSNFVDTIPEIVKKSSNLVLNDIMSQVFAFYNDHETAKKLLNKKMDDLRNELLMLYRQRNQIVHNAIYEKTLVEFNITQIKSIVVAVLFDFIEGLKKEKSINAFLMNMYVNSEKNLHLIKQNKDFVLKNLL